MNKTAFLLRPRHCSSPMHVLLLQYLSMCQRLSRHILFNSPHLPSPDAKHSLRENDYHPAEESDIWKGPESIYDAWLASREVPGRKGTYHVAGAQRPLSLANTRLAICTTIHGCVFDFAGVSDFASGARTDVSCLSSKTSLV